jgi:hypothetical protein
MSERTLRVVSPHMRGDDVTNFQRDLIRRMHHWGWTGVSLVSDGDYGPATRSYASLVLRGLGISQDRMKHGITPDLRVKMRHARLTPTERVRYAARASWRKSQAQLLSGRGVARPLNHLITDSWGFHPGIHDGVDLICVPNAPIYAMVKGIVTRADPGGWWGLGAPSDPKLKAKGDGIIIVRSLANVGPFKKGINMCYGHAEGAVVKVGQHVHAGQRIGHAGFANAWHVHFMINDNSDTRGVGDRDPRPLIDYAFKHGK